ncbi:hypothetical protein ACN22W_20230 [Burkholderia theae]|uniref:hypothetical protein n=1 Tax=Burkholderia theae TaxID=3143496 RepID=UPI003AFA5BB5
MKIERAQALFRELDNLLGKERVFEYVVETDYAKGERWTRAKKNEEAADRVSAVTGDIVHNLRSALDHAFWDVVSPHVPEREHKRIQFPYAKDESRWPKELQTRFADCVSNGFYDYVKSLNVFSGSGGGGALALLHEMDIQDKHKFPLPVGDFTKLHSSDIIPYVHDFPGGIHGMSFGRNNKDVLWKVPSRKRPKDKKSDCAAERLSCRILPINIDVCFAFGSGNKLCLITATLSSMIDDVANVVAEIFKYKK